MRLYRGSCHYGRELLPDLPFGWRELFTRGLIVLQRKRRPELEFEMTDEEANDAIASGLSGTEPFFIARFGTGELEATLRGRDIRRPGNFLSKSLMMLTDETGPFWWDNSIRAGLCNNAGVFPPTKEIIQRFSDLVLSDIPEVNVLGSYSEMPIRFRDDCFPETKLCAMSGLEPFWRDHPWTEALVGQKVLVIHSMPNTIASQYAKRRELFSRPTLLPEFELITYRSVNSAMGQKTPYATWFDALDKMKSDIATIDFDTALIGCGAYGMNLGAFIKRDLKKKAFHIGGMTQLLFGIIGRRWESVPKFAALINDAWTRPLSSDTPADIAKIEGGCYW